MQKNKYILAILCLFVFAYYIIFNSSIRPAESDQDYTAIKSDQTTLQSQSIRQVPEDIHKTQIKDEIVITTNVFSDDPLVDKFILKHKFTYCIQKINSDTSKISDYIDKKLNKNTYPKREKIFQEHYLYCEKIIEQHPQYHLQELTWNNYKNNPPANSLLGQVWSGEIVYDSADYDIHKIIKEAKDTSPNLFLAGHYLFVYEYFHNNEKAIMELLQSRQKDYVLIISDYAQNLYACRHGADCGKNSTLMLSKCLQSEKFCVDNYEKLISEMMTQGQQADIKLVFEFYETFFSSD
ncbi:MAG: hypothetical protein L3J53_04165 [Proteobacteria bacterium]|nr:hypothetical protein [Pseudomonadota bacterium]